MGVGDIEGPVRRCSLCGGDGEPDGEGGPPEGSARQWPQQAVRPGQGSVPKLLPRLSMPRQHGKNREIVWAAECLQSNAALQHGCPAVTIAPQLNGALPANFSAAKLAGVSSTFGTFSLTIKTVEKEQNNIE